MGTSWASQEIDILSDDRISRTTASYTEVKVSAEAANQPACAKQDDHAISRLSDKEKQCRGYAAHQDAVGKSM